MEDPIVYLVCSGCLQLLKDSTILEKEKNVIVQPLPQTTNVVCCLCPHTNVLQAKVAVMDMSVSEEQKV